MAQPRRDSYGRRIQALEDARQESLRQRPQNVVMQALLLRQLDTELDVALHRGFYGELTLRVIVQDGIIQESIQVGLMRSIRVNKDEEDT